MATFNFLNPDYGAEKSVKPRLKQAKFGDGYSQEQPDGLNFMVQEWSLKWSNAPLALSSQIEAFFVAHMGYLPFDWTTPDGEAIRVKCRNWSFRHSHYGLRDCAATFEQVFE